jgi:hypothetical protein
MRKTMEERKGDSFGEKSDIQEERTHNEYKDETFIQERGKVVEIRR